MTKRSRLSKVTGRSDIIGGAIVSASDTMRWGDTYQVSGRRFKISRLVGMGLKSKDAKTRSLSKQLESDLKGGGLEVGFPLAFLAKYLHAEGKI